MSHLRLLVLAAAALCLCAVAAPARADWSGDTKADVLAVDPGGRLLMYRGTGAGAFVPGGGLHDRHRLGLVHRAARARRLERRRQAGPARAHLRGRAADVPRQRPRRLPHRPGRDDRQRLAAVHRAAHPARLERRPPARPARPRRRRRCCSCTAATAAAASSPAGASRSAPAGDSFTALFAPGDWSGDGKPDLLARDGDGRAADVPRQRPRRLRHRPARDDRLRLAGLHRALRRRRLQRRRQAGPRRPRRRRAAVHVPRQRPRRLRHRPAGADRQRLELAQRPDARSGTRSPRPPPRSRPHRRPPRSRTAARGSR